MKLQCTQTVYEKRSNALLFKCGKTYTAEEYSPSSDHPFCATDEQGGKRWLSYKFVEANFIKVGEINKAWDRAFGGISP